MGDKVVFCVCLKGENRSRYLAKYLISKGYVAYFGGIDKEASVKINRKELEKSQTIIVVRPYIFERLKNQYDLISKKVVILDVSDDPKELGAEAQSVFRKSPNEFQNRYVRPKLRSQVRSKFLSL